MADALAYIRLERRKINERLNIRMRSGRGDDRAAIAVPDQHAWACLVENAPRRIDIGLEAGFRLLYNSN